MNWTHTRPTITGPYWCRVEGKDMRLCLIIRRDGEFRVTAQRENEFGTPLEWFKESVTEWIGPLHPNNYIHIKL